ncbi:DUF4360 domain-containing protein [Streptomyces bambusae]|uniref:DUF4360 domain-containing protein n=1 Tax=Streptomyces bambusae TaxID=1550616 RepID=UPI001CFF6A7F|nr:DUF4360 domain-containing protein [Streptomyces bambusae]MCB5170398.1 DUF4360 domain-containing protein [Streptomyces bambusae]
MFKKALTGGAGVAVVLAAALCPGAGAAAAADSAPAAAPPTGQITIDVAQVNGSGCRPGSASVSVAPDNTAFTVTYSEYLAQVGRGALATDFRKNCQLGLRVNVPQGFTYAVAQADYRGFASLQAGASATQQAGYYFQGMTQTVRSSHTLRGPLEGNWQVTDRVGIEALEFAPCGSQRDFNVNTELRVSGGTSDTANTTSFVAMDSTDASFKTVYRFAWKECPVRR